MYQQNYQHLGFEYRGRVLTVTMNRPEVRNAADIRMHRELSTVFRDVAGDATLSAALRAYGPIIEIAPRNQRAAEISGE